MTNLADGTTWTEAEPALTDPRYLGQQEIRGLRTGTRQRLRKEHEDFTTGGTFPGGEHKLGSAKAYYQVSGPMLRPDGTTTLTAADNGRLWVDSDDNKLYVYIHPTWTAASAVGPAVSLSAGDQVNLRSITGWTNTTGSAVQLYAAVIEVTSPGVISIQYNHGGAGWGTVGQVRLAVAPNSDQATLTVFVANGSAARVQRNSVDLPAGNLTTATYQRV